MGQDITEQDNAEHAVAIALRRCQVLDHILWSIRQEVLAPRMMQLLLDSLAAACGADGIAIIDTLSSATSPTVLHQSGGKPDHLLGAALTALDTEDPDGAASVAPNGTRLLTCLCHTRAGDQAGLVVWRSPGARPWDDDDRAVTTSAAVLVRMILEHESIQREMTRQARTDPLTGLLNRRAFMEEAGRRTERLDREGVPSTLMFVDLDGFKQLNDGSGHDVGDEALRRIADLLREAVRPTDLVARLGGDEFAIWMDGADELAASERAERLCIEGPEVLAPMAAPLGLTLSLSIGITTRWPGRGEDVDALIHRADQVMYEVKRAGRGHWRVSRSDSW